MPRLFIENLTSQFHEFNLRDSRGALVATRIRPGEEVLIGDLSQQQIDSLIEHYEQHVAFVQSESLPLRPGFVGLAYRIVDDDDDDDL